MGPISVIDTAKRSAIASITVSTGQYDIALSRDGRWLYAADVSDLDTDKVVATILPVVSSTTNWLEISSNGKLL